MAIPRKIDSARDAAPAARDGCDLESWRGEDHGEVLEDDRAFRDDHRIGESGENAADLIEPDLAFDGDGNPDAAGTMNAEIDGGMPAELEGAGRDQRVAPSDGQFQASNVFEVTRGLGLGSIRDEVGESAPGRIDRGLVHQQTGGLQAFKGGLVEERSDASLGRIRQGGKEVIVQCNSG